MTDSWLLVMLQVTYQRMLVDQPHISRQRVREMWEERQTKVFHDGRNVKGGEAHAGANMRPQDNASLAPVMAGWNDIIADHYAKAYEDAPQGIQNNYEMGRALAVIVRRHQKLAPWPPDMTIMQMYEQGMICDEAAIELLDENKYFVKNMKVINDKSAQG